MLHHHVLLLPGGPGDGRRRCRPSLRAEVHTRDDPSQALAYSDSNGQDVYSNIDGSRESPDGAADPDDVQIGGVRASGSRSAETPSGGVPDVGALLDTSSALAGGSAIDLVTIDMPVSTVEITGRREADSAISREFGSRGCSTHSPSTVRPGAIGRALTQAFADRGYDVATTTTPAGTSSVLMEVYPHTALLSLMTVKYRVPYKVSRAGRYWPDITPIERRRRLAGTWREVIAALGASISGIELPVPAGAVLDAIGPSKLKRYEDALDALICGWVGIQYLNGNCRPFGGATAAIWAPESEARGDIDEGFNGPVSDE